MSIFIELFPFLVWRVKLTTNSSKFVDHVNAEWATSENQKFMSFSTPTIDLSNFEMVHISKTMYDEAKLKCSETDSEVIIQSIDQLRLLILFLLIRFIEKKIVNNSENTLEKVVKFDQAIYLTYEDSKSFLISLNLKICFNFFNCLIFKTAFRSICQNTLDLSIFNWLKLITQIQYYKKIVKMILYENNWNLNRVTLDDNLVDYEIRFEPDFTQNEDTPTYIFGLETESTTELDRNVALRLNYKDVTCFKQKWRQLHEQDVKFDLLDLIKFIVFDLLSFQIESNSEETSLELFNQVQQTWGNSINLSRSKSK